MTSSRPRSAPRRRLSVGALDRPWHRHFSSLAVGPLKVPTVEALRELFAGLMADDPELPLLCTIGDDGKRWVPVPAGERDAFLARVVSSSAEMPFDDTVGHIERHRPPVDTDLPLSVVLGPESVVIYFSHLLGDANTFSRAALMIATADGAGLATLRERASFRDALRILRSETSAHWREWARLAMPGRGTTDGAVPAGPVSRPPRPIADAPDPRAAEAVLTNAQVSALTKWRNQNCRGVSITAVLTSAVYRALVEHGVPMDGDGFYSLFDLRRYLPAEQQGMVGNLAKSVYLSADLTDPAAIAAAMDAVIDSARPVPGLVAGAAVTRIRPPQHDDVQTPGPISMSFSSMPTLPGLADLPWLRDTGRRYVGYGYPVGVRGISIFAIRLRDRMELTASFDGRVIDPAVARRALAELTDVHRLLGARV